MIEVEQRKVGLYTSFKNGIKNIFQITAYIIIIGCILDSRQFASVNKVLFYLNMGTIVISILVLIFYYSRIFSYKTGFIILIYTILVNLFLGKFLYESMLEDSLRLNFFLRDSLFVILLLTLASFAIHRMHAILIGLAYLGLCIAFSLSVNITFLRESFVLLAFIIVSYCGLIWYLVGIFEKVHAEQHEQSVLIQQQSEELIRRNAELANLNRSKDIMMSVVGHDLKNPFNTILLAAQLLRSRFNILQDDKKKEILGIIESTSSKTYLLFENLLKWASIQTELIKFVPGPVNLKQIIRECLDFSSESIVMKKISVDFNQDEPCEVFADQNMVGIVVRNLISNAVKFTNPGGIIHIECEIMDQAVKCTVADNGVGLNEKELGNLFDMEKRIPGTGTSGETGTGLGLILSREFLIRNRGDLEVESKAGEGSRFSFTLPRMT
jgi:signal transduction histidine kinase